MKIIKLNNTLVVFSPLLLYIYEQISIKLKLFFNVFINSIKINF